MLERKPLKTTGVFKGFCNKHDANLFILLDKDNDKIDSKYVYMQVFRTFSMYLSLYRHFDEFYDFINTDEFLNRIFPKNDYEVLISNIISMKLKNDVLLSYSKYENPNEELINRITLGKYDNLLTETQKNILLNKRQFLNEISKNDLKVFGLCKTNKTYKDIIDKLSIRIHDLLDLHSKRHYINYNYLRRKWNKIYKNILNNNYRTKFIIYEVHTSVLFYLVKKITYGNYITIHILKTSRDKSYLIIQSESKHYINVWSKQKKEIVQQYITSLIFEYRENAFFNNEVINKNSFSIQSLLQGEKYSPLTSFIEPLVKII
jgi:hypothetical protein